MPVFEHVSRYPHPRSEVYAWHTRPGAFARLTPPGMATVLEGPSDGINPGSEILLRISHPLLAAVGPTFRGAPLGVNWRVRHVELVPGERFVDEQVSGPFKSWRHEHHIADGPAGSTIITDRVHYELPVGLPSRLDAALVDMQLDGLFRFRERQLRDDLDLHAALGAAPRRVVVGGASGLIGTQIAAILTTGGHEVLRLVRGEADAPGTASWDPVARRLDPAVLEGADAALNLGGSPIAGRFTPAHKTRLLTSRLDTTATMATAVARAGVRTLVQASAIGFYGARRPGEVLTERSRPGEGSLATVVRAWEAAARPAADAGVRVPLMRTGIVLSEGGGALAPQVPLFSLGVGGRLAAPDAWMSWITLDDTARGFVHALLDDSLDGPVNLVAPRPVTNAEFAATLGRVLHRPSAVPVPAVGPKALLGAEGYDQIIDTDQRVSSALLGDSGFRFTQHSLADALRHVLMR